MKRNKAGILVVLMFVFTAFFAVHASAAETTVTTADDFATQIVKGGEVVLGNNIELTNDVEYPITSETKLDLNGHTLTVSAATRSKSLFTIGANGEMEITDTSAGKAGKLHCTATTVNANLIAVTGTGAKLTLTAGTIEANKIAKNDVSLVYVSNGSFKMNGGLLKAGLANAGSFVLKLTGGCDFAMTDGELYGWNNGTTAITTMRLYGHSGTANLTGGKVTLANSGNNDGYAIKASGNVGTTLTLDGVEVTATNQRYKQYGVYLEGGSSKEDKLIIKGTTKITSNVPSTAYAVWAKGAKAKVSISGSAELKANSSCTTASVDAAALYIEGGVTAEITGTPKLEATNTTKGKAYAVYANNGTITEISGGTFNATTNADWAYSIYPVASTTISEISGGTFTAERTDGGTDYAAIYINNGCTVGKISGGTFNANYCVYDVGTITEISGGEFNGGTLAVILAAKGTLGTISGGKFTGDSYAVNNNGTITTISGGSFTGGTYAVRNASGNSSPTIGTISGGTYEGGTNAIYNGEAGTIGEISNGTFSGDTYGMDNSGTITTISGGTIKGGEFGLYSTGTIGALGTADSTLSFSGERAGAFLPEGTVTSVGKITIADNTPWGVVYCSETATVPEDSTVTQVTGATKISEDEKANYKDIGITPTVSGNCFYANGFDITISARAKDPGNGCVISYSHWFLGDMSFDTGKTDYYIFAGGNGKRDGQDGDTVGTTLVTSPCLYNKVKDTITVTMNGGKFSSLYGGGNGNTKVTGKVVMNLNGGTAARISGGGSFVSYNWGQTGYGRGWAVVEDVEMNINGSIKVTYSFNVAGTGVNWVENAVLNINSTFTVNQSEINVAGEWDRDSIDNNLIKLKNQELGLDMENSLNIDYAVAAIKAACLDTTTDPAKVQPRSDGVGSVVMKVVVNSNASMGLSIHGGNYGSHMNAYVDDLTVNINNGGRASVNVADTYGHVETASVNVKNGGTLASLTQCRRGTTKDLTVNIEENGMVEGSVTLGKLPWDDNFVNNFIGGGSGSDSSDYFVRESHGGITSDAVVRIHNANESQRLQVKLWGGVVSKDIICTGNVSLEGGGDTTYAHTDWTAIRPGAKYKTTDFTWSYYMASKLDYSQQGYLLVTGDLHYPNVYRKSNLILGSNADTDGKGDGKMYVYQNQYSEEQLEANSDLKTKYEVDGTTVVLGILDSECANGKINGIGLDVWSAMPIPTTIVENDDGTYTVLDSKGVAINTSTWTVKFLNSFDPDADNYVDLSTLSLSQNDELRYTITRNNVTFFGTSTVKVNTVNTITYDLNGSSDTDFATTQSFVGESGYLLATKPSWVVADTDKNDEYFFLDWNTEADGTGTTYLAGDPITVSGDITLYAQWAKASTVTVVVGDEEETPVTGAQVSMQIGGKTIRGPITTDAKGTAVLTRLPYGTYNLVIETTDGNSKTIITTLAVDVHEESLTVKVVVPGKRLNTVVSGDSHVAVDGVEDAISAAERNTISTEQEVGTVTEIDLTVTAEPDYRRDVQTEMSEKTSEDQRLVEYVEVTVQKVTTTLVEDENDPSELKEVSSEVENIKETDGHLTITFHTTEGLTEALAEVSGTLENVFVYHRHEDENGKVTIQQLRKVSEKVGQTANYECFYIREIKGVQYITVRANRFSTYALGVQESKVSEYKPSTGGSAGGSVEDEITEPDSGVSNWLNTYEHNQYLAGYPNGTFCPNNNMTRAEVAQMFYNLLLDKDVEITTTFSDVPETAWYAKAVNTLASIGMISGVGNNKFEPERTITRAEFTTLAMKFAEFPEGGENIFSDVKSTAWYYNYIVGATQYSWISGYPDGTFRPQNPITRAEVTSIVNSMLGRSADADFITEHESELKKFTDLTATHWAYAHIVEATNSHDYEKNDGENWLGLK